MITKQQGLIILGGIVLVAIGVWVFIASPTSKVVETAFSEEGFIVKESVAGNPDIWRLNYGASQTKELNVAAMDIFGIENGMKVKVRGVESNNKVLVSSIGIINANKDDLIWVASPLPNQKDITSPLTVAGFARGNWYFEASFPIKVLDGTGKVLTQVPAQAQGEWMTTDYVPFSVTLTFTQPTTADGMLVLEKDNPSGLPENDNELRIPIKFKTGQ